MSNTNNNTSDDSDIDTLPSFQKMPQTCVWCKDRKVLMDNVKYCRDCYENRYKLCIRCKLPYPDAKYFQDSGGTDRCNACYKKYVKEREKRLQKMAHHGQPLKRSLAQPQPGTSTTTPRAVKSSTPSSSSDDDDHTQELQVLQTLLLRALKNEMKKKKKVKRKTKKSL